MIAFLFLSSVAGARPLSVVPGGSTAEAPADADKSVIEVLPLLGGSLGNGDFQRSDLPDRDGWQTRAEIYVPYRYWHADRLGAALLDPGQEDNHAYWCGDLFASCNGGQDLQGGYGNGWDVDLAWHGVVPNPAASVTVTVRAMLTYDLEYDYDFLTLDVLRAGVWQEIASWTGPGTSPVAVNRSVDLAPTDLGGPSFDEVYLRWRVRSDGAWSDEDCLFDSEGAARLDNLEVLFDQGGGAQRVSFDDVQPATPRAWVGVAVDSPCSDAAIWPDLSELGSAWWRHSPVLGFLAAGGCGPAQPGEVYTYGPGGLVVSCPPQVESLVLDYMASPVVSLPPDWQSWDGALLDFDVYVHQPRLQGPFVWWGIRTSVDGVHWRPWRNHDLLYEHTGVHYDHYRFDVTALLADDPAPFLQVGIGTSHAPFYGPPVCRLLTPAPWYDDIALSLVRRDAPDVRQVTNGRALSGFPAASAIDPAQPAAAAVAWSSRHGDPTAPVTFEVAPSRSDAVVTAARLHWRLRRNPVFDPYRGPQPPNPTVGVFTIPAPDQGRAWSRYKFELPDAGFLFPGDVLQYYVEAQETRNGEVRTATLPADTTGVSVFPGDSGYALPGYTEDQRVSGLPSVFALDPITTPSTLVWVRRPSEAIYEESNDGEPNLATSWLAALDDLGWQSGEDFDFMYGGRVAIAMPCPELARYRTIIIDRGEGSSFDIFFSTVLSWWLGLGDRHLLRLGAEFHNSDLAIYGLARLVTDESSDARTLIDNQASPAIASVVGNPLGLDARFAINTRPHWLDIDAIVPADGGQPLFQFLTPEGAPGAYPVVAGIYRTAGGGSQTVALPAPLTSIVTAPGDAGGPASARSRLLAAILAAFGVHDGQVVAADHVAPSLLSAVRWAPNPLNPRTTLRFVLARNAQVAVDLYDLRGRHQRRLLAGALAAGAHELVWDGDRDDGDPSAAGVYLAVVAAGQDRHFGRLTLVR